MLRFCSLGLNSCSVQKSATVKATKDVAGANVAQKGINKEELYFTYFKKEMLDMSLERYTD